MKIRDNLVLSNLVLTSSEGRFFCMYSSVSSSHSAISYIHKIVGAKEANRISIQQKRDREVTFSFNANAGKIAESRSEEKCGETSLHPCKQESRWPSVSNI
jgi:hypothetical protein